MQKIQVSLVMGSDSDFEIATKAIQILDQYGIEYEVRIISAHRDTETCLEFAREAHQRGIQVIIAIAGLSAHLAGVIASNTPLPVIGVPLNRSSLAGLDAVYSIMQMPSGIPVAMVGIDNTANAALMAVRILALHDKTLLSKWFEAHEEMKKQQIQKNQLIQKKVKNGI
ncbi:5-(carboxyamino)imidazole ribonucleotide mutase [bacterium]|nr:5-(carboxyamino)imidazole ribonucleotide mutase [bacterium]